MMHETLITQPVIQAPRFILRPPRKSDAGLCEMYTSDKRVAENTTSIPHPLPPGATEAYLVRIMSDDRSEHVWIMDGADTGLSEVLGMISLEQMDRDQSEIGYWVGPQMWNTGFASDAVKALVDANPLNNKTIFASVFQDNPGSARVLTNVGFDYLGDAEAFSVARNSKVPTWTYLKKLV
jgi:RimJ/RimL family protein N-acetyltransferase